MTSLATCIRKMGPLLNKRDADAIREILTEGGTADNAVSEYLGSLGEERASLIAEIEARGGRPGKLQQLGKRLTMAEIDFEGVDVPLSPRLAAIQQRFADEMTSRDWDGIVDEYMALDGTQGPENTEGGKINSVDAWRELSVDYRGDRTTSAAVHEVASAMSKKYFAQRLSEAVKPFTQYYLWTSGGTGAGKTTGLGLSMFAAEADHIFDGNLAKFDAAVKKIDQALDAGRLVDINHVIRDPIEAFVNGAVKRAIRQEQEFGTGRIVPLSAHVGTHVDSALVIKQLVEHYRGNPLVQFEFTDNALGFGNAKTVTVNEVLSLDYDTVMREAKAALLEIYENGHPKTGDKLSDQLYYGFLEQEAPADSGAVGGVPGQVGAEPAPVYSKPEQGVPSGVRQAELQLALAPAIRALVGTVRVDIVQTTAELPGEAVPTDVEGVFRPNTGEKEFWLVADNLPSAERAKKVFAHEGFGHLAMERTPEFVEVLASVKNLLALGNRQFLYVAERVAATQGNLDETTQAKEILAYMAENGIENGTIGRAIAAVKAALRRMGLLEGVNYSEAEIKDLLVRAARDLVSDASAKQKALASLPLQEQILTDPTAVADAVHLALKEVYADQTLMDATVQMRSELETASPERRAEIQQRLYLQRIEPEQTPEAINPDALYSRVSSFMQIDDSLRNQPPQVAAVEQFPRNEAPTFYWQIASEAGTRAFAEPQGSWEERYYTEIGRQASQAARNPAQAPVGEQMALFSRYIHPDPEIEAIRARRLSPAMEDITVKDRLRDVVNRARGINWLSIKQGMIDGMATVGAIERGGNRGILLDASVSAYKAALATKNLGSVMGAIMQVGIPVYQNGVFRPRSGRKGLLEIAKPIASHKDGNLLPLWELYIAAYRASRLITEKNPDGSPKEKNFTQAEIDKALTLAVQYPEFETARQEWQKFNSQLLDLAIKNGVINGEEAKFWRRNDYVPFYRVMETIEQGGQGPRGGGGLANVRSGIRRLTGADKPIGNVFENMVMNTSYLIDAIYRNTAMQRIVAMTDGIALEQVPMAWEAQKFRAGDIARALMNAGLIVGEGATEADMFNDGIRQVRAMSPETREEWVRLFRRVAPKGDDIVSVLVNGKPVYYRVLDPLLLRSIGSMGAQQFGGVMNTFRFAKRTLTRAVVIDPAFMMANFIRDTLSSAVVVKGPAAKQISGAIKGLKAAWNEDPEILEMMMAGAGGGGYYEHNPIEVRKMLAKRMPKGEVGAFMATVLTPRTLWRFWQRVGNASEQANRVAVYKRVIAEGGTAAEAAFQARDVLNFSMSGDYEGMKMLVQMVPFLNARIQGLYRLARGAKENPVGFAQKGGMIAALTIALLLKNRDDERYTELPEWDKDIYWHFYIGDEHFRLPKPFEVGVIFGTVFERSIMLGTGDDSLDVAAESVWRMLADTFAFNPTPQLIKPVMEQYANRNMFTGNPIIGMHHEGLEPEAQYDPWTSETMRELAKIMPDVDKLKWLRSPKRLESFLRGYTASFGMYMLGASNAVTRSAFGYPDQPTKGIRNWPVITRFWRDPNPRTSKHSNELYEMLGEADSLYKTMNAYRKQRRVGEAAAMLKEGRNKLMARKFLHDIAADLRKVNAKIRLIQYSNIDPDDKQIKIDKLNQTKLKLLGRVSRVSDIF